MWRTRAWVVAVASALICAVVAGPAQAAAPERITFGDTTCAPNWPAPNPGHDTFAIVNQATRAATVYLFRADSGTIVAQLNGSRPGTTRLLSATLTPGPYAWGCDLQGYPRHTSEADPVVGHRQTGGTGPPVVPVAPSQLIGPLRADRTFVAARLAMLGSALTSVRTAIAAGDLAGAESAWLSAHADWLLIGQDDGAYGAFGALGGEIDGTAAGHVGGVASPGFTGFHKLELDLWTRHDLTAAAVDATQLTRLVNRIGAHGIAYWLPGTRLGLINWTLRPHEILEDALRDSLSADDDYGSHSDLVSLAADVAAIRELLRLLDPVITPRSPYLVGTARRELTTLTQAIAGPTGSTGSTGSTDGVAVAALPLAQRESIDAAAGAALETLAPIPDLLRMGNT